MPVFHIRHVFFGKNAGDNTFVSVAPGHLVTFAELALGRDKDFDDFVDAWIKIVAFCAFQALNVDNRSFDSVRYAER